MANLNLFSGLFGSKTKIEKSEAELALERANKLINEKTLQAKEFVENKVKLEKEIELKRQQASEELAQQAQVEKLIFKTAKAVEEAQEELEKRKYEFHKTASEVAEESAEIEMQITSSRLQNKKRVQDFSYWLDQYDEEKKQPED